MRDATEKLLLVFSILATLGLLLNMVAIPLNTGEIFWNRDTLAPIEAAILAGFLAVLVLDLLAMVWAGKKLFSGLGTPFHWVALALAGGCLILLAGDKVLLDEIAREQRLGMETEEWLILYICFAGQLVLNLLVLFRLLLYARKHGSGLPPTTSSG